MDRNPWTLYFGYNCIVAYRAYEWNFIPMSENTIAYVIFWFVGISSKIIT